MRRLAADHRALPGGRSCRAEILARYWYDGALEPQHADSPDQRRVFDGIAFTPGVQLRLGHLAERRPNRFQRPIELALRSAATELGINAEALVTAFYRHWTGRPERQQKGVDTLITLDLVWLAQCGAFHIAVLVAEDRDLAEPVRTAQDAGRRIVVATVGGPASLAKELAQLTDEVIEIRMISSPRLSPFPCRRNTSASTTLAQNLDLRKNNKLQSCLEQGERHLASQALGTVGSDPDGRKCPLARTARR